MERYIPERMCFHLDDESAQKEFALRDEAFKVKLMETLEKYTGQDIRKYLILEYKSFENSNTHTTEIRCCDRLVALIYETRTEFNHQEVLWIIFTDVFPKIRQSLIDVKSRDH